MNSALLLLDFSATATATVTGSVPEPSVVFYRHVTRSPLNTAYETATVTWSLSGNGELLVVSQTTVVPVNGETFYITRETRENKSGFDAQSLSPRPPSNSSVPGRR